MTPQEITAEMIQSGAQLEIEGEVFTVGYFFNFNVLPEQFYFYISHPLDDKGMEFEHRYIRRTDEGLFYAVATKEEWLQFFKDGQYTIDQRRYYHEVD